jgi:hypothetical protein
VPVPEVHIQQILHKSISTFLSSIALNCLFKSECCYFSMSKFCSVGFREPGSTSCLVRGGFFLWISGL